MTADDNPLFGFHFAVVIPTIQSIITGTLAAGALFVVSTLAGWDHWMVATAGGMVGTLGAWLHYRSQWLTAINALVGVPAGDPEPQRVMNYTVRVPIVTQNRREGSFAVFPATVDQLNALGRGMLSPGAQLTESRWTGSGNPFTKAEFTRVRAELVARQLAVWRSPRTPARGCELTAAGRACMRYFAKLDESDLAPWH